MIASVPTAARTPTSGNKVDIGRGARVGRVSSEWFSRPDDERFLSLDALFAAVNARSEQSRTRTIESAAVRVEASRDDPEALTLPAGRRSANRAHPLEFRPTRRPDRRARRLSTPASGRARRHQPAIWAHLAPARADQDAGADRRSSRSGAHRTARGDWPRLRPHPRSRAGIGRPADSRQRHRRYPLEDPGRARLGNPHL